MNNKVVLHLVKHCLQLKKSNYQMVLSFIVAIIILKIFMYFYNVSPDLIKLAQGMTILGSGMFLLSSYLIPAQGKITSKKQGSNYSWSYILSTVRFTKAFLGAIIIEYLIDSMIFAIVVTVVLSSLQMNPFFIFLLSLFFSICLLHFIRGIIIINGVRSTKSRGIVNNDEQNKRLFKGTIFIVAIGIGLSNIIDIPMELFSYILIPCLVLVVVIHPFSIYSAIVEDPNEKENKIRSWKYVSAFAAVIIGGGTYFYFDQVKDGYQIFRAISTNDTKQVKELIIKDKNVLTIKGKTTKLSPLFFAAKEDHPEIVKTILENGGNINELDHIGNNLLTYSAGNCNLELSEFLVAKGINFNQMPSDKENPLFTATSRNCLPLIMYFRKLKMNEIQKNAKGQDYIEYGLSKNDNFNSTYKFLLKNNLW